jgi:hypothetical protein
VQIVRLHDPLRRQFAIFASDADGGGPRDLEGAGLATADAAVCAIVDTLDEARAVCDAAVTQHPTLRLDVFDAEGRARSPLLTVAHPQRAATLEHAPRQMRTRQIIAWILIALGVPQVVYAYRESANRERDIILPAFIGINMILFGGRLLWLNLALRETERAREARIAAATAGSPPASSDSADPTRPSRRPAPR